MISPRAYLSGRGLYVPPNENFTAPRGLPARRDIPDRTSSAANQSFVFNQMFPNENFTASRGLPARRDTPDRTSFVAARRLTFHQYTFSQDTLPNPSRPKLDSFLHNLPAEHYNTVFEILEALPPDERAREKELLCLKASPDWDYLLITLFRTLLCYRPLKNEIRLIEEFLQLVLFLHEKWEISIQLITLFYLMGLTAFSEQSDHPSAKLRVLFDQLYQTCFSLYRKTHFSAYLQELKQYPYFALQLQKQCGPFADLQKIELTQRNNILISFFAALEEKESALQMRMGDPLHLFVYQLFRSSERLSPKVTEMLCRALCSPAKSPLLDNLHCTAIQWAFAGRLFPSPEKEGVYFLFAHCLEFSPQYVERILTLPLVSNEQWLPCLIRDMQIYLANRADTHFLINLSLQLLLISHSNDTSAWDSLLPDLENSKIALSEYFKSVLAFIATELTRQDSPVFLRKLTEYYLKLLEEESTNQDWDKFFDYFDHFSLFFSSKINHIYTVEEIWHLALRIGQLTRHNGARVRKYGNGFAFWESVCHSVKHSQFFLSALIPQILEDFYQNRAGTPFKTLWKFLLEISNFIPLSLFRIEPLIDQFCASEVLQKEDLITLVQLLRVVHRQSPQTPMEVETAQKLAETLGKIDVDSHILHTLPLFFHHLRAVVDVKAIHDAVDNFQKCAERIQTFDEWLNFLSTVCLAHENPPFHHNMLPVIHCWSAYGERLAQFKPDKESFKILLFDLYFSALESILNVSATSDISISSTENLVYLYLRQIQRMNKWEFLQLLRHLNILLPKISRTVSLNEFAQIDSIRIRHTWSREEFALAQELCNTLPRDAIPLK